MTWLYIISCVICLTAGSLASLGWRKIILWRMYDSLSRKQQIILALDGSKKIRATIIVGWIGAHLIVGALAGFLLLHSLTAGTITGVISMLLEAAGVITWSMYNHPGTGGCG